MLYQGRILEGKLKGLLREHLAKNEFNLLHKGETLDDSEYQCMQFRALEAKCISMVTEHACVRNRVYVLLIKPLTDACPVRSAKLYHLLISYQ